MSLILPRRQFLAGLATALAAPAIVRAESLMPVRAIKPTVAITTLGWADPRGYVDITYHVFRVYNSKSGDSGTYVTTERFPRAPDGFDTVFTIGAAKPVLDVSINDSRICKR